MRAMVAKTVVVAAATGGLAASFLLPLAPHQGPAAPEKALRMPVATRETTISVFPACIIDINFPSLSMACPCFGFL